MTSYIEEFKKKEKPSDYYSRLLSEVEGANKTFNVFLSFNKDFSQWKEGMPFSVKSNICVKGSETSAGSKMLKGYVPPYNATSVERMLGKKYRFIGETNMDEFGFGTFGINCEVPTKNAFNEEYVAGGSSSGAAVATALIKYHVALAESTGGSIATPAAFNGVVGFTPTYGAVSRYGLIDYANSLDKIGVIARSSEDVRTVFDIIRGKDDYDTTCVVDDVKNEKKSILFVIDDLIEKADEGIRDEFEKLLQRLEAVGYRVERIKSDVLSKAVEPYYIIAMAEASTTLAKYTGYKYGFQYKQFNKHYNEFFTDARENFGSEAKRRIILGTFIRSVSVREKYYTKALMIRRMIINEMNRILKKGFIISPTMPITTPKISEATKLTPVQNYALDLFTIPPNLGGFPHISFPYAYVDGMPIGAQVVGESANDHAVIDFVGQWEKNFSYKFKQNLGAL
jgi:aspartyl-tRNA(Asn)/glutamyl-tRNA(Gln) amidotransferase subunit A